MDISNVVAQVGSVNSSVTKTNGAVKTVEKSLANGNALPDTGQVPGRFDNASNAALSSPQKDSARSSQPNSMELDKLVEQANQALQGRFSDLKFTTAEGTNINVVRVEDAKTGELIRQIPAEVMVAIAQALDEAQQGMMLKEKA